MGLTCNRVGASGRGGTVGALRHLGGAALSEPFGTMELVGTIGDVLGLSNRTD
jgi:hypothetical protein